MITEMYNAEHYKDMTAAMAISKLEGELEQTKLANLMPKLRQFVHDETDGDLVITNRIEFKGARTGRYYK